MSKTVATQAAALVLSALATFAVVAGANGIATHEYATADALATAQGATTQVAAIQTVVVVGHRIAKA
jgi:hypothetical protein